MTVLCISAYTDIRCRIIPNSLLLAAFVIGLIEVYCIGEWKTGFYGILAGSILLIPYHFGGCGEGDVKLFMVLGLLMGPGTIVLMAVSFFLVAAGFAMNLLVKKEGVSKIPLAPYVLVGYLLLGGVFIVSKIA